MSRFVFILFALFLAGCGAENQVGCTSTLGPTEAYTLGENSSQCPIGMVLVGYDEAAVGGPLLCATITTSCPQGAGE